MNYLKLVNFELGRAFKLYVILLLLTIVSQLIGTFTAANHYMDEFQERVYMDGWSTTQFLEQYGEMSLLNVQITGWFNLPIAFGAVALIFYCFLIWYRDWFGKNTFIYRLLMLPTNRITIYFSKATAIFLMVLGLVALQIILLVVEVNILKVMVPANLRMELSILQMIGNTVGGLPLGVLLPVTIPQLFIHYGVGFMWVFVGFTAILFERSFRLAGMVYGGLYVIGAILVFYSPYIVLTTLQQSHLYPLEMLGMGVVLWTVVTGLSIWVSYYLINRKVSV